MIISLGQTVRGIDIEVRLGGRMLALWLRHTRQEEVGKTNSQPGLVATFDAKPELLAYIDTEKWLEVAKGLEGNTPRQQGPP